MSSEREGTVPAVSTDTLHTCERGHEHPPPVTRCGCGAVLCPDGDERLCAVCTAQRASAAAVPAPSDEGKRWTVYLYPNGERSMALSSVPNTRAVEVMPVAEAKAREAEGRAEERAATLREVINGQVARYAPWLASNLREQYAEHFNPEAE